MGLAPQSGSLNSSWDRLGKLAKCQTCSQSILVTETAKVFPMLGRCSKAAEQGFLICHTAKQEQDRAGHMMPLHAVLLESICKLRFALIACHCFQIWLQNLRNSLDPMGQCDALQYMHNTGTDK